MMGRLRHMTTMTSSSYSSVRYSKLRDEYGRNKDSLMIIPNNVGNYLLHMCSHCGHRETLKVRFNSAKFSSGLDTWRYFEGPKNMEISALTQVA